MLPIGKLPVKLHSKVSWCRVVWQRRSVELDLKLAMSLFGVKMEGSSSGLSFTQLESPDLKVCCK